MTWNKPTLRKRFENLSASVKEDLTNFLFARYLLAVHTANEAEHVEKDAILVTVKRAIQLYRDPKKMGIAVNCMCPSCGAQFRIDPEDPIYICPSCANTLDRCEWLLAIVFDYMNREILYALIDEAPEKANALLELAGRTPDLFLVEATVASFKFAVLQTLRENGEQIPDELIEQNRKIALCSSFASLLQEFCEASSSLSPSRDDKHMEGSHEAEGH